MIKIKIKSCDNSEYWYYSRIGKILLVTEAPTIITTDIYGNTVDLSQHYYCESERGYLCKKDVVLLNRINKLKRLL